MSKHTSYTQHLDAAEPAKPLLPRGVRDLARDGNRAQVNYYVIVTIVSMQMVSDRRLAQTKPLGTATPSIDDADLS
jgi:hypothetical protein